MADYYQVILRSIVSFCLLLIGSRILGKQTLSQMTIFDFIASITMGGIAANVAFNTNIKTRLVVLSLSIFIAVIFLTAFISLKSRKGRKFFAGDPTIIIQNGKILEKNMSKMRYTLDYLNKQDIMTFFVPEKRLPIELIMDGTVINDNLKQNNLTLSWLQSELDKRKVRINDVMYAVLAANQHLYIDTFNDYLHSPIDKE
ncbi:YetF domain-containing protein [Terrilactibacillus laevilacticus]|uniref:YetF domain-containing protein n=1 Tax=Terrilactibacillus laevilacticus TaxID=1380157 RepID=UPI0011476EBA|nr:DUF421 domain-containing protein [Terrilactibacillus laevilacticus]